MRVKSPPITKFKLIVNCGPCAGFIGRCLHSVKEQTHTEWEAYITVDPCGDDTVARAVQASGGDPRIRITRNETRRYSMENLVRSIDRSQAEPEDVIAVLDGDDWFSTKDALRTIADAYEQSGCWMTYGSWLSNVARSDGGRDGMWPAYPEGTTDFRRARWLGTAVRTWRRWLWDHLSDSDLRDDAGNYFRVSEDQAIMIPLLEMCGTAKARHIATPIMVYNKLAKYPVCNEIVEESERNGGLLDRRPSYSRLTGRVYARVSAAC
jgi:glycosyltransferase involved in cell wall biosynthesis